MASILILGGGFGGLAAAHELRTRLPDNHEVTVVAADDHFYIGFAKLWDLVGTRPLEQGTASLSTLKQHGIRFVRTRVTAIDPSERRVDTESGSFSADFLLVALGAGSGPERFLRLRGPAHDLYDANELPQMRADLAHLDAGTLVVAILGAPYKCPPAPYEAAFLLDEHLRGRGVRDAIELVVTTPQPMTLPAAGSDISQFVAEALEDRGIERRTEHSVQAIDVETRTLSFAHGGRLQYALLLAVPQALPPQVVADSPLAGEGGWIQPNRETLLTRFERVYAAGDCTASPPPKAESSPKLRPASPHATSLQRSMAVPAIGSTALATVSSSLPANVPRHWRANSSPSRLRYGWRGLTPRRSPGSRPSRPSGSATGSMSA
jgi:sulfide:quinone oxidoreductase